MLRRMIVPIFVIFAVAGVATMCTAVTGAKARRRLQHREVASLPPAAPARPESLPHSVAVSAPEIGACPERLADAASWRRMSADGAPIEIPVPPDFEVVPQTGSVEADPPFLVLRATNGDEYRLTRGTSGIGARDFRDYESTSNCRITIGDVIVDIETARDTWRGGEHRAVLASFRLGMSSFITVHGTTETEEHQRQLVAAMHGARFRAH